MPHPKRSLVVLVSSIAAWACGGEETLVLGGEMPRPYRFSAPEVVSELSVELRADNPCLTADLLEIYFTSSPNPVPAPPDIWSATRARRSDAFGDPMRLSELSTPSSETSPVISADGLTLWFASDRLGGSGDLDIWVSTRNARSESWSAPENLGALNTEGKEIPRPPGQHERVMPLASDREMPGFYQIYLAERDQLTAPFEAPVHVAELAFDDQSTVDGFLTDDGLSLFYVTGPEIGPADMFVASRRAVSDPFEALTPLTDLNTESDERDPWLSADGSVFFFASDRSGRYEIYVAQAHREAVAIDAP